jgi:uncharacterized protein
MQEALIREWIADDPVRMRALRLARELDLPDWYIGAGFVRNLVWDKLHAYQTATPLDDIDLIYFDPDRTSREHDRHLEARLAELDHTLPWSVHNQARMHEHNGDRPYQSALDAIGFWVEQETAVAVRLDHQDHIEVVSAFGLESLFDKRITPNRNKRNSAVEFSLRLARKNWLWIWPELRVES